MLIVFVCDSQDGEIEYLQFYNVVNSIKQNVKREIEHEKNKNKLKRLIPDTIPNHTLVTDVLLSISPPTPSESENGRKI